MPLAAATTAAFTTPGDGTVRVIDTAPSTDGDEGSDSLRDIDIVRFSDGSTVIILMFRVLSNPRHDAPPASRGAVSPPSR